MGSFFSSKSAAIVVVQSVEDTAAYVDDVDGVGVTTVVSMVAFADF